MNATANPTATSGDAPAAAPRTNRGTLDTLTIRRRTTGEEAAARARFMRRMRIALPIIALILIAAFFFNTRKGGDDAFLEDFADLEATPQSLKTAKPQFSGVDARGNPYEITADSASREPDREAIVELEHPRAVTAGADQQSVVAAEAGVFNTDDKKLLLKDGVTFERAIGRDNYVLTTPTATVSIDEQTLVSEGGVTGEGPGGAKLKADKMSADNREGVVVFEGNVSMRLHPKEAGKAAGAPEEAAPQPENGENE